MKVTLRPVDEDDDWRIELEVEKETTVGQFKAKIVHLPESPTFTKTSRILFKGSQGPMYSLQDNERVKKTMLFADPSAVKKPPPKPEPAPPPPAAKAKASPKPAAAAPKPVLPKPAQPASPPQAGSWVAAPRSPVDSSPKDPVERLFNFPFIDDMTPLHKERVTRRLQSAWPRERKKDTSPKSSFRTSVQAAEMARAQAQLVLPEDPCLVSIVTKAFGLSADLMDYGPSGLMHVHQTILYMADEIVKRFQPIMARFGYPPTAAGYVEMDKAIALHTDNSEVWDAMTRTWCMLCFGGRPYRSRNYSATGNIVWMGIHSNTVQMVTQSQSFLYHLALPPLERRWRSGPRTIALVEAMLQPNLGRMGRNKKAATNRRVVWILGATEEVEGEFARREYFEDAAAFVNGDPMTIHLVGDNLSGKWPTELSVKVHAHSWSELYAGGVPDPEFVMIFNSGLGTLDPAIVGKWLPRLVDVLAYPTEHPPVLVLTSRCLAEIQGEEKLLHTLSAKIFMPTDPRRMWPCHMRNLYSGMAGDPYIDYDDNGWIIAVSGSSTPREHLLELAKDPAEVCRRAQEAQVPTFWPNFWQDFAKTPFVDGHGENEEDRSPKADEGSPKKKDPAVFWGILDLKYVPSGLVEDRVKVLETGDGRSSRFSGYGAAILENFKQENKLEDTLRRAVLVENKKLTHDIILDTGYSHIRPQQEYFPRVYSPSLAGTIKRKLGLLKDTDICVLKLPNRTRGAGVIPICISELDQALRLLLQPPSDIAAWLRQRDGKWARKVSWGCFEEQLRHWWSNESPCFLVEEFCCSMPTPKEVEDGSVLDFDGTMRVGFSLHREPEQKLPPGWVNSDNGPLYVGTEDQDEPVDPKDASSLFANAPEKRPLFRLFPSGPDVLRLQWLGGYWKLPVEDVTSSDLRGRVVSVAKRGTAPVPAWQLHEVYAALGDAVSLVFNTKDISHTLLLKRYSASPEWGAFVVGRLACSMRIRDRDKSRRILMVAQQLIQNLEGVPRDLVASYIERNQGVMEALFGRWNQAQKIFEKSLVTMPANATSRFLVGLCLLEQGEVRKSITLMEEALQLDPDFKAPYVNLGLAWLRLGEYLRTIEVCEAGEKRHPNTPWALYNLGAARYALAALHEQAQPGDIRQDMRRSALEALEFARDNVGKDGPWNEQDDQLVASLKDGATALPVRSAYDGWRFINWRP